MAASECCTAWKLAELTSELHPLAGVRDGEAARRIERTDDLDAARPRAAAGQFVGHDDIDGLRDSPAAISNVTRPARFARQVVAVDFGASVDQSDMQRIGRPRRQHDGG